MKQEQNLTDRPTPGIVDAVVDQSGTHWIRYGTPEQSIIFSLPELQTNEKDVFARLSGPGTTFLTPKAKNAFKALIEAQAVYRPALVASHPGWLEGNYVFGDGTVEKAPGDRREIIIGFEPRPKFKPEGTLKVWQQGTGAVIAGQPLPLFAAAYAFVGPLLRFAPPDLTNPEIEIVGDRESGKSTLLTLCCSAWSGDPTSDVGGAELWDRTINTIDIEKLAHADGLLGLDEGNLAERELIGKAVFKLASTGVRKRYTDKSAGANVRLATLSTSNLPLNELVTASNAVLGAMQSRMCTIPIPKGSPHGVLKSVPKGFSNSQGAMEALKGAINANYGSPGRAFVKKLVRAAAKDEAALRSRIKKLMDRFSTRTGTGGSARIRKTFALTFAAGILAREWGILPMTWGPLLPALLEVYRMTLSADELSVKQANGEEADKAKAMRRVQKYARRYRKRLIRVRDVARPYRPATFSRARGFVRRVGRDEELLIPSTRFRRYFRNPGDLARQLRSGASIRTEGGKQPKLTIKAPRQICKSGRVYCIRLRRC